MKQKRKGKPARRVEELDVTKEFALVSHCPHGGSQCIIRDVETGVRFTRHHKNGRIVMMSTPVDNYCSGLDEDGKPILENVLLEVVVYLKEIKS
jgi:hypothetical protein